MKKNIAMRVAAFLFILTMISTCAFATTFAKYTTSADSVDIARVAKFGVTISVEGENSTFSKEYDAAGGTVKSLTEDKVVAPGTQGNQLKFVVNGDPEVDVEVTFEAKITLTGWAIPADGAGATEIYCPLIITVDGVDYKISDYNNSLGEFAGKIEDIINKKSREVKVGSDLGDSLTVSWRWDFENTSYPYQSDVKDTALGENPAASTITIDITCTVEQID